MIHLLFSPENLTISVDLSFYKWVQIYHLVQCKFARGHFNRQHGRGHSTQPPWSLYNLMPSCILNQYFFCVSITRRDHGTKTRRFYCSGNDDITIVSHLRPWRANEACAPYMEIKRMMPTFSWDICQFIFPWQFFRNFPDLFNQIFSPDFQVICHPVHVVVHTYTNIKEPPNHLILDACSSLLLNPRLFPCLGLTSLFNIWDHITTVPACNSGTLTNVLPHRNTMP